MYKIVKAAFYAVLALGTSCTSIDTQPSAEHLDDKVEAKLMAGKKQMDDLVSNTNVTVHGWTVQNHGNVKEYLFLYSANGVKMEARYYALEGEFDQFPFYVEMRGKKTTLQFRDGSLTEKPDGKFNSVARVANSE
jgi:hypothetical protein